MPVRARPSQPEVFVRGCVFAPAGAVPYPRLSPADADQLPADVWDAAAVPAMVRLEMVGDASEVVVGYRTTTADLGYRGDAAGCTFVVLRGGHRIAEVPAELGEAEVRLPLGGDPTQPVVIHLPEGMRPIIVSVRPTDGRLQPAPRQPRCLVAGDAVAQGWLASSPVSSWPAILGRKLGLDVVNLACAGTARLEPAVAIRIASLPTELLVVAVGNGSWSRPPRTAAAMAEEVRSFLELVRAGHPSTPIVVVSPLVRPAAEDTPNLLGATLGALRRAVEDVVAAVADDQTVLVPGEALLGGDDLVDGVYPGDEGHRRIAAAVAKVVGRWSGDLRRAAVARWQEELLAATPLPIGVDRAGPVVADGQKAPAGPPPADPATRGPVSVAPGPSGASAASGTVAEVGALAMGVHAGP